MNSNAQHTNAGTAQAAAHPVVGRFAPSPSGRMHLGNVYSALVAWLSVRSQNGRMVLRIEDLDERCRRGKFDEQLIADLRWLGLDWDEGPYYQSDRLDLYRDAVRALASQDLVYPCFCTRAELHAASAPHASDGTPLYPGTCRNLDAGEVARRRALKAPALRLKVPDEADPAGIITFNDRTYGTVSECLAADCGDFLIQRSDGVFAYQLVVTVDDEHMGVTEVVRGRDLLGSSARQIYLQNDFLIQRSDGVFAYQLVVTVDDEHMGVTEVVRGRDLLGSSARQIYLQNLLGYNHPSYAHVPLLAAPDGRRLSKRDRDCDMGELMACFGTPEKLLGHLSHIAGIAPDSSPRSVDQLVDLFSWRAISIHSADIVIGK